MAWGCCFLMLRYCARMGVKVSFMARSILTECEPKRKAPLPVIVGLDPTIQKFLSFWIPACAGMTQVVKICILQEEDNNLLSPSFDSAQDKCGRDGSEG